MIKAERRPLVTVSYAQSIDGSIASRGSDSLALSCHKSLEMTHFLRSQHDGLLVGINTVLIDNPRLTVRHFEGPNPQPIILDSLLRFPENARMLEGDSPAPVILTTEEAPEDRKQKLESLGISVVRVKSNTHHRVDLMDALDIIATLGFTSIMVEGGGSIIGQFLGQEFADYCIVTIAPRLIGGLKAVEDLHRPPEAAPLVIENCEYQCLGSDMIAFGELKTRT
ncbi:MAG: RibD family protein [Methylococcales bacterium]|nr:RibD family protein [Methylococcales bacterium]